MLAQRWLFASPGLDGCEWIRRFINILSMASFILVLFLVRRCFVFISCLRANATVPKQILLISDVVFACEHIFRTGAATPLNMGSCGGRQDWNTYNPSSIYRCISVFLASPTVHILNVSSQRLFHFGCDESGVFYCFSPLDVYVCTVNVVQC